MKVWGWTIKIKENQGTAQVNIKFGITIKSKNFMSMKKELEAVYDNYKIEDK